MKHLISVVLLTLSITFGVFAQTTSNELSGSGGKVNDFVKQLQTANSDSDRGNVAPQAKPSGSPLNLTVSVPSEYLSELINTLNSMRAEISELRDEVNSYKQTDALVLNEVKGLRRHITTVLGPDSIPLSPVCQMGFSGYPNFPILCLIELVPARKN